MFLKKTVRNNQKKELETVMYSTLDGFSNDTIHKPLQRKYQSAKIGSTKTI